MKEMREDWDTRLKMDSIQGSSFQRTDHQVPLLVITALLACTLVAVKNRLLQLLINI